MQHFSMTFISAAAEAAGWAYPGCSGPFHSVPGCFSMMFHP